MYIYKTVCKAACAEQIIEKSRFITSVSPVSSKEEADAFIAAVKAKYRDATHNVPAIVIGEKMQLQWASDDGEPQGTSGAPMLMMLVKEEVTDVALVVTRYFGGIKLGTGGLVRAYTSSAKLGIEAAGICEVKEKSLLRLRTEYGFLSKLKNMSQGAGFEIAETEYGEKITVGLICDSERRDELLTSVTNLTSGTAEVVSEESVRVKEKIG